jgi:hypothetical protein
MVETCELLMPIIMGNIKDERCFSNMQINIYFQYIDTTNHFKMKQTLDIFAVSLYKVQQNEELIFFMLQIAKLNRFIRTSKNKHSLLLGVHYFSRGCRISSCWKNF